MAIWLHTKTAAQCKAAKQEHKGKLPYFTKSCHICGKQATVGRYCQECNEFIKQQHRREKKRK